jgi:nucleoside kinase
MMYVSGMIAYDTLFAVKEFPQPSSSSYIEAMEENFGGAAGNCAYACARWGEPVSVISVAGMDFPGSAYERRLRESGVVMEHVKIAADERTAQAFMVNDRRKRMISFFYWGAASKFSGYEPPEVNLKAGDILHIASGDPVFTAKLVERCTAEQGGFISFDPGYDIIAYDKKTIGKILSRARFVFGNEFEMKRMRGLIGDPLALGAEGVIETIGAKGAWINAGGKRFRVRAVKARVVDTVGAGDAYRAGFLCASLRGYNFPECGEIAAKAAAFALERIGAQENIPEWEELLSRQ